MSVQKDRARTGRTEQLACVVRGLSAGRVPADEAQTKFQTDRAHIDRGDTCRVQT